MKNIVYVAVALSAAAAGYGLYHFALAPEATPAEPIALNAPPAAEPEQAAAATQPPTDLPDFSLLDRAGEKRSIRSWQGKSMVVNFWATWCTPCRREIPLLRDLQKKHAEAGLQVVGVAVDFRDDVLEYADEIGIDYPLLIGEQDGLDAVNAFGMGSLGFPFTIFTDNQHRIVATHLGELTKPQSDVLIAVVNRVNSGELTPAAARTVAARELEALEPTPG